MLRKEGLLLYGGYLPVASSSILLQVLTNEASAPSCQRTLLSIRGSSKCTYSESAGDNILSGASRRVQPEESEGIADDCREQIDCREAR